MRDADDCQIRPMRADDLDRVLAWRNHPGVRRFMLSQHEITLDEHRGWFERASADPSKCLLILDEAGHSLGFVQFSGVAEGAVADWGFYAAPEAPKGTGRKLGSSALRYAFDTLALHKVCGQALALNQASISLHKMLGFREEGILREQHRIGSVYHDLICFGLLSHDWLRGDIT